MANSDIIERWEDTKREVNGEYIRMGELIGGFLSGLSATDIVKVLNVYGLMYQYNRMCYEATQYLYDIDDSGGTIDPTYSFDGSNGFCGVYRTVAGGDLYPCNINYATKFGQTIAASEHFNVVFRLESVSAFILDGNNSRVESGSQGGHNYKRYVSQLYAYVDDSEYYVGLVDTKNYFDTSGSYQHRENPNPQQRIGIQAVAIGYIDSSLIPVIPEFYHLRSDLTDAYCSLGSEVTLQSDDISNSSPWDYYNEFIKGSVSGIIESTTLTTEQKEELMPFHGEDLDPSGGGGGGDIEDGDNPPDEEESQEEDAGIIEDIDGEEPEMNEDTWETLNAVEFISMYDLSREQVNRLGRNLWTEWLRSNTSVWKNIIYKLQGSQDTGAFNIASYMDLIVSLRVYPFAIPGTVGINGYTVYDNLTAGTGHMPLLDETVHGVVSLTGLVDCGTVTVLPNPENDYYDFRNYVNSTITVLLPFCGICELNPSDVWGRTLRCKYYVDFTTGSCTACVFVETEESTLMVASKSGQIGFLLPISATNAGQVTGQFISDASNAVQTIGSTILSFAQNLALGATHAPINEASKNADYLEEVAKFKSQQSEIRTLTSNRSSMLQADTSIARGVGDILSRSGISYPALSAGAGLSGMMMYKTPFITIRRPKYKLPNNYHHSVGWATTMSGNLGSFRGFNQFKGVDVKGIDANYDELLKIKELLETGIYVTNEGQENPEPES